MESMRSTTIPSALIERVVRGRVAANLMLILGASMIVAMAAQVAVPIPFSPVPLTLQPLAVLLIGAALGSTRGAAALVLYLLEGAGGLPVFAQGHGGPVWLMSATAGYLFAYPLAAFVAGWFSERGWGNSTLRSITGMLLALGVIYAGGWSWLSIVAGPEAAFTMGVAPFVIADMIKIAIGASLLPRVQRLLGSSLG